MLENRWSMAKQRQETSGSDLDAAAEWDYDDGGDRRRISSSGGGEGGELANYDFASVADALILVKAATKTALTKTKSSKVTAKDVMETVARVEECFKELPHDYERPLLARKGFESITVDWVLALREFKSFIELLP